MHRMVGIEPTAIPLLKLIASLLRANPMKCKLDIAGTLRPGTINILDDGIRGVGRCLPIFIVLIDADHFERQVMDLYISPKQRATAFARQLLRLLIAQNQHLALLPEINLVDKPAAEYLYLVHLHIIGINAGDVGGQKLVAIADGRRDVINRANFVNDIFEVLGRRLDIALTQTNPPAFFHPLVCLRRPTAVDTHRIREKTVELRHLGINQAIARTQQHNQDKNTPYHRKAGQRSPQLVAARSAPYF